MPNWITNAFLSLHSLHGSFVAPRRVQRLQAYSIGGTRSARLSIAIHRDCAWRAWGQGHAGRHARSAARSARTLWPTPACCGASIADT